MRAMLLRRSAPITDSPLDLADLPVPEPGPGEILVHVSICAVCRTDLHVIEGDLPSRKLPLIPGHQIVGRVEKLGEGCGRFHPGDRVGIAWPQQTAPSRAWIVRLRQRAGQTLRASGRARRAAVDAPRSAGATAAFPPRAARGRTGRPIRSRGRRGHTRDKVADPSGPP